MEVILQPELQDNDNEFMQGNSINIHLSNNPVANGAPFIFDHSLFQKKNFNGIFSKRWYIPKDVFYYKCGNHCILTKDNQVMHDYIWICMGINPKHDAKINIRTQSFLERLHLNIQILYFVIFHCFTEAKIINDI